MCFDNVDGHNHFGKEMSENKERTKMMSNKNEKKNKLKVAPTTTKKDKEEILANRYAIIKRVKESQGEVHEECQFDQVKQSMGHTDRPVEMCSLNQNSLVVHIQFVFDQLLNQVAVVSKDQTRV